MKTIAFSLVALGALLILPATSWADSGCGPNGFPTGDGITCVIPSGGSASLQTTQVPASTTIPIPGFNPALGTLDEVDCCGLDSISGTAAMTVTYFNANPFPTPFDDEEGHVVASVRTPSGSAFADGVDEFECFVGPLVPGASQTNVCPDEGLELSFGVVVSPKDLAQFISTGNVLLPASLDFLSLPISEDMVTFDSISMRFDLGVTYVYTPAIPEPASDVLVFTALTIVGLCCLRKHPALHR